MKKYSNGRMSEVKFVQLKAILDNVNPKTSVKKLVEITGWSKATITIVKRLNSYDEYVAYTDEIYARRQQKTPKPTVKSKPQASNQASLLPDVVTKADLEAAVDQIKDYIDLKFDTIKPKYRR